MVNNYLSDLGERKKVDCKTVLFFANASDTGAGYLNEECELRKLRAKKKRLFCSLGK